MILVVVDGGGGCGLWGWWLLWWRFFFLVFAMRFDFGMGIDYGGGGNFFLWVILVVKNWCLWLSFGGRWLCGFTEERERKRGKGRDESELFILFNVIVYIILMSCI